MGLITTLAKTSAVILLIWYTIKYIMKRYQLEHDLSWLPGPKAVPILGNMFDLLGMTPSGLVKLTKKWHKLFGSFYVCWIGPAPKIMTKDPDIAQALSNIGKYTKKTIEYRYLELFFGENLLTSDGDIWYRKRKLLTPCFHYEILDSFMETMNIQSEKFVKYLSKYADSDKLFNFLEIAQLCTLDILMETSMGVNVNALEDGENAYVHAIAEMREVIMARSFSFLLRTEPFYYFSSTKAKADHAAKILKSYVDDVVKDRRKTRKMDSEAKSTQHKGKRKALLDMFLDLIDSGIHIDDEEIRNEVNTFMFAGHDTTSVALSYFVYLMGRNPEIQEKVYQEIVDKVPIMTETGLKQSDLNKLDLMDRCMKETLRMFPPVPIFGKLVKKPLDTGKGVIPSDSSVTTNVYWMHNDEKLFTNPNVFDPDRFLSENLTTRHCYSYIPFSSGARNCIGQKFAQNELKTVLAYLLKNYKIESVQSYDELNIGFDMVLTPENGIMIKIKNR